MKELDLKQKSLTHKNFKSSKVDSKINLLTKKGIRICIIQNILKNKKHIRIIAPR